MRRPSTDPRRLCPRGRTVEQQVKSGYNRSGTQRCQCKLCGTRYTLDPKKHEYPDEIKQQAFRLHSEGKSGRQIGRALGMNKANVYHWLQKQQERE